ncbi:DUF2795 domain-containing protein [Prauserella rugosa]|uniref:Uncharacterized protein DUF2795 n=1 Tax=Prauserella rugosa TaxID=43354 RepID=A0A660CD78_9PSEU|nr:DUF2795 domain-containing protein [Prauserella rugosa]KMS84493.1 hypothetical protein ACZ91_47485 [Streptomyces regensis]TWH21276.1 uncharacterized protein DUF2795 [Prauserella rugosa]
MSTDRESLKEALSSVDFPADKETLVSHAQTRSGDDSVAQALRAMPPAEYANLGEVIQSVPLDSDAEEGRSSSDKAQQARHNSRSGLAERETETPANPIARELGENRGS